MIRGIVKLNKNRRCAATASMTKNVSRDARDTLRSRPARGLEPPLCTAFRRMASNYYNPIRCTRSRRVGVSLRF